MANITGTLGNDFLAGTQDPDLILALAGNDTVLGFAGNDTVNGNEGSDTVRGGLGDDYLRGGKENDFLYGDFGRDTLFGDLGNDTLFGNEDADIINGNQGDDAIDGNQGSDTVRGGQGNDLVRGGQDNDEIYGDQGNDTLYGEFDNDTLFGGQGIDLLFGNEGDDEINGNQGNDTLFGGQDNDYLRGGQDNDLMYGDLDNDTLFGDLGNDTAFGGLGNDLINGNEGADILNGNEGLDTVRGGIDNDLIRGGQNDDLLYGDKGNDTVYGDFDNDIVFGGEGTDLLFGNEGDDVLNGNEGQDTVFGGQGADLIRGGQNNDSLFGDRGSDTLFGDLGADTLTGDSGGEINTDVFVFGRGTGGATRADADVVTDWQGCIDLISLTGGLSYADLNIQQGTGADAANTIITDNTTGEFLAVLLNTQSNLIDGTSFTPAGPAKVSIAATNPTTIESTPSTAPGLFTVSIPCETTTPLTINYTISGTATNGTDYTNLSGSVTIAAGTKSATIPIAPIDDTTIEPSETVTLTLAAGTGYDIATSPNNTGTVTILDNDSTTGTTVNLFASDPLASEVGPDKGQFTFVRTGDTSQALTVNYSLSPTSTATNGTDYTANPVLTTSSITIPAGSTSATIDITPITDNLIEGNETVNLLLGGGTGYTVGPANQATVVIQDTPVVTKPTVFVTAPDPIATESGSAQGTIQFARTGGDTTQSVTIKYTVSGTATPGSDYSSSLGSTSGTVTIVAGQTVSPLISITPANDGIYEPTETVIVNISEDSAYFVGSQDSATVSILDNTTLSGGTPTDRVSRYNSNGGFIQSYSTIQTAVDNATNGEIIVVTAGTYSESVTIDKQLTIRGPNAGLSPSSGAGVAPATVIGSSSLPVFTIGPNGSGTTIEGLTIQGSANTQNLIQYASNTGTPNIVIRQNQFTGTGPAGGGVIRVALNGITGSSATIQDNLFRDVVTTSGNVTSAIQAFQIDTIRITDNIVSNLPGPGIVADSITNSNSIINNNDVSNIGQQGIQLAGGSATIANNDITNVNLTQVADAGGIRLRRSGLTNTGLGTANIFSNTITNSFNGIAIRDGDALGGTPVINNNNIIGNTNAGLYHGGTGTINATNNWWDDPTGPILGGTGRNAITGSGATSTSVTFNPFSNQPF